MLKNVNYYQWIMLIKKSAFHIGTIGVGTRGVKVGHIMNKIYIFAASILFVLLGMTISRADDSVLIIKCSNAVDRGVVILDSTPRMNCRYNFVFVITCKYKSTIITKRFDKVS